MSNEEWFTSLATEVGDIWRSTNSLGVVSEATKDVADEEEFGRMDMDVLAEELVLKQLASKKGYAAIIPAKRKTLGHVWGYLKYDNFLHIALINVRTVFDGHHLVTNMAKDKHTLEHLCVLTLKTFLKSENTPEELRKTELVVSAGLAEVVLKDMGDTYAPELKKGYFMAGFTSPGFTANCQLILKDVHTL